MLHPLTVSHTRVVCALVPQEGSALEPWELMEVLLDRKERESPAGVRHPSTEWRYIMGDKEYMSSPIVLLCRICNQMDIITILGNFDTSE